MVLEQSRGYIDLLQSTESDINWATNFLLQRKCYNSYIKVATESIIELAKTKKLEFKQRFSVGYGWIPISKTTILLGVKYQLAD